MLTVCSFLLSAYSLLLEFSAAYRNISSCFQDVCTAGMGFLLRSLKVTVALTSEMCHKTLPREPSGEVGNIKGWPKLLWLCPESFSNKPPKDWTSPADTHDHTPAYIEVCNIV